MSEQFKPETLRKSDTPPRMDSVAPPSSHRASLERMHEDPDLKLVTLERVRMAIREIPADQCPSCFPLKDDELNRLVMAIQDRSQLNAIDGDFNTTVLHQLRRLVRLRAKVK